MNQEELKEKILNLKNLSQEEQKDLQKNKVDEKFVNESMELNPENIKPVLINVDSKHPLWKEWRAICDNVASFEFRRSAGRNCYFLVKNEYDNKNLGILCIGADFISLGGRDSHIGWNIEQRKKMNRHIANISACIPTRHFGYNLSGGKLLTLLAASDEVAKVWKEKYGDDLVGLTVTSLYGKSVQYNRLKHFKYLGKTKGQGTCQIPDDIYRACRKIVEDNEGEIPSGCFTKGKNSRINIVRKGCKYLGIDAKVLTTHGRQRGIYWCDRGNTSDFLTGKVEDFIHNEKLNNNALITHWKYKWAYRRLKNLNIELQEYNTYN